MHQTLRTSVIALGVLSVSFLCMFFAALPTAARAQATPSVMSVSASPSYINNAYSAAISWTIQDGGGHLLEFTCPAGVSIKTENGSTVSCGTRFSASARASDTVGFVFMNVAGVPRSVTVRVYPKDTAGTAYESYKETSLTVGAAYETIASFAASATTLYSGDSVSFTWEGRYIANANMRFDCASEVRFLDQSGNSIPCATTAFTSDLPASGSQSVTILSQNNAPTTVTAYIVPAITTGLYDGGNSRSVVLTVRPKPPTPDPAVTGLSVSSKTIASGDSVLFTYTTQYASSTNLQFSCAEVVISNGTTTLPCNMPALTPPLSAVVSAFPITFTNRTYSSQLVRTMVLAQKPSGDYFYGGTNQLVEITVLPIGQKAVVLTPIATQSTAPTQTPSVSAATKYVFTANLRRGITHRDVTALQTFLALDTSIYPEKAITGYFGPATEAAVKRLQRRYGIEQTGTIGPLTRAKLNSLSRP